MSRRGFGFAPHRVHPRFAGAFRRASAVPGGLRAATASLTDVAFDLQPSATDDERFADTADVGVVVCGFPRSGTTYLEALFLAATGEPTYCRKTHDAFSARRYADLGLPVLVPVRDPAEVVVSWGLYHRDEPTPRNAIRRLDLYTAWHRHVRRRLDHVSILDFTAFTWDPVNVLRALGLEAPGATPEPDEIVDLVDQVNGDAGLPLHQRNAPDERRAQVAGPYRDAVRDPTAQAALSRARRAYDSLRSVVPDGDAQRKSSVVS